MYGEPDLFILRKNNSEPVSYPGIKIYYILIL